MEKLALSNSNDKKIYIYVTRAHLSSTASALCLFFNFVLEIKRGICNNKYCGFQRFGQASLGIKLVSALERESHILTDPSLLPVIIRVPSALNDAEVTSSACP